MQMNDVVVGPAPGIVKTTLLHGRIFVFRMGYFCESIYAVLLVKLVAFQTCLVFFLHKVLYQGGRVTWTP
jgi:hypothetical protein